MKNFKKIALTAVAALSLSGLNALSENWNNSRSAGEAVAAAGLITLIANGVADNAAGKSAKSVALSAVLSVIQWQHG